MGIIRKQSINNSINIYVGIIIGAINTILIFPYVFESNPEYWGLLQILISYSFIFSTFFHFGSPNILLRYFPKSSNKTHIISLTFLLCTVGFLFFLLIFLLFHNSFLTSIDATDLLFENFYLVCFLVFSLSFFDLFSSLSRSYLDSSTPVFFSEVFIRICVLLLLIIYHYNLIQFIHFLYFFIGVYLIRTLIFLYIQIRNNRIKFNFNTSKLNFKDELEYGFYVLTAGGSAILVSRFDMLMIEYYIDLKHVAYYTLAFFIGSVIKVPSRSISFISSPLIAKYFEEKDYKNIQSIYSKTSINLLIIGGVVFLCVMLNVEDILNLLPEKFSQGKYVVLFIGLAQLVNLVSGNHNIILVHSPYYKSIIFFNLILLLITFLTNLILIPIYGINGAAFATFISIFIFNLLRMYYVYLKLNFHPFSTKTLIAILTIAIIFFSINYLPFTNIKLLDILIRSLISCILIAFSVKYFNLSSDISSLISEIRNNYLKI